MLRVLIAEDNATVREGLRDCVSWKTYGVTTVTEACDGSEAMSSIRRRVPDIVLTDVKMPVVDGIELANFIRRGGYPIQVIFISCHWETPYLKSAFRLDAVDYIQKPIDLRELDAVLSKATQRCRAEQLQRQSIHRMETELEALLPMARQGFVTRLLHGGNSVGEGARLEGFASASESFVAVAAPATTSDDALDPEVAFAQIRAAGQDIGDHRWRCFCATLETREIATVVASGDPLSAVEIDRFLTQVSQRLCDLTGHLPRVAAGGPTNDYRRLDSTYIEARSALAGIAVGGGTANYAEWQTGDGGRVETASTRIDDLEDALAGARYEDLPSIVDRGFSDLELRRNAPLEAIQYWCLEIVVAVNRHLLMETGKSEDVDIRRIIGHGGISEIRNVVLGFANRTADLLSATRTTRSRSLVAMIKRIVLDQYAGDLTVQSIAEQLQISPNYASQLFRQESGETLHEYITAVRIKKAKELLRYPVSKLYEVAFRVGYNNPDYFSTLFKRKTGLTPSEYRNSCVPSEAP